MGKIDAAVAATEATPLVQAATITVTVSSGRMIGFIVPSDLTALETLDMVSFVSTGLGPELVRRSRPALGRIHLPRRV